MSSKITDADRRLMAPAGIDLGGKCEWCGINEVREQQLRDEITAWTEVARVLTLERNSEILTVRDQGETIDRLVRGIYQQKTHFWMLAIIPVCMAAYALYQVRQ